MAKHTHPLALSAIVAFLAFSLPSVYYFTHPYISSLKEALTLWHTNLPAEPEPFQCLPHTYSTEIISLDPLLIYIHDFLNPSEISALLEAGEPAFKPSEVTKSGRKLHTNDRTSSSAGLPRGSPAVECVLARAQRFMGTMLRPTRDEIGPPQLVRYSPGQRFNLHHDWYDWPQPARPDQRERGSSWNRVASFFAILQDDCEGGETYFPNVEPAAPERMAAGSEAPVWRAHEDGGMAFRPVKGNALFWVNLHANETGDKRVMHAGLPVTEGRKTAMNIWPRRYYS